MHFSQQIYDIIYTYYNDLLKASKHALLEVALQRRNIILCLLREPLLKQFILILRQVKFTILKEEKRIWKKYGNFQIFLEQSFRFIFPYFYRFRPSLHIKATLQNCFRIKLITRSSRLEYFSDVKSSGGRETNNSQIELQIINYLDGAERIYCGLTFFGFGLFLLGRLILEIEDYS